ncbi:MAG: AAA family ATPase [Umezawaea sp.]
MGRRAEVELVRTRVREAAAGLPGVLLVRGSSGIGKSALLSMVCEAVRDQAEVLSTTCAGGGVDFAAFRSLFGPAADQALADADDSGTRVQQLVRLAIERGAEQPLVLVLDDAHLCDADTARCLGLLARRASGGGLFVVLAVPSVEPVAAEKMFAELTGALDTTVIDLGPLPESEVRELIRDMFGVEPHDEYVRVCMEVCSGIPYAVVSSAASVIEQAGQPDQEWADRLRVAATAESVVCITWWLSQQAEPIRLYATSLAILGGGHVGATAALFELSPATAEAARTTLRLVGVLTVRGTLHSEKLRDDLLASLDPRELAALRARAARLLSDEGRPRQEIAEQIVALPVIDQPWMMSTLREAARDCADRPDVAAGYLRRALEVAPDHIETRLELAKLLAGTDPDAARLAYADVLGDITDVEARASVAAQYGIAALRAGHARESFGVLADTWRVLPADVDQGLRATIEVTMLLVGLHDLATVGAALAHAREISPPAELRTQLARRLVQQLARAELLTGESPGRTLALTRSALTPLAARHDRWDLVAATSLHYCGDSVEALAVIDRVLRSAEAFGDEPSRTLAIAGRAWLLLDRGELVTAASDAEQALSGSSADEGSDGLRWSRTVLALVCASTGEDERAAQLLSELYEPREPLELGLATTARARLLRNNGQLTASLDLLLGYGEELETMGARNPAPMPWWVDAVALLVELGRQAEADELAERGAEAVGRWDTQAGRGYVALARGLVTGHIDTLEDAALLFAAAGFGLREVQALTALGTALLRHGDDKAARRQLRAAVDLAVRCGDIDAAGRARTALREAGGRMGEVPGRARDVLTDGERRVAELAAAGLTNRQIADALFVTVRTVESHLSNTYRKSGVQERADLATLLK